MPRIVVLSSRQVSTVARIVSEARKQVESGFEYVTEAEGAKVLKRRGKALFEIFKRHPSDSTVEDTAFSKKGKSVNN